MANKDEDDGEAGGEAEIEWVGGEREELGEEGHRCASNHRGYYAAGAYTSGQEEGHREGEEQRHGSETQREETEVVDEGALETQCRHHGKHQQHHDGKTGLEEGVMSQADKTTPP